MAKLSTGISMGIFHPIEIIGSVKNHWCIMLSSPEISREPLVLSWNFITNNSAVMFIKRSGLPAPRHRFFQVICWPLMACERRRAVELKNHRSWGYPNIYSHDFFMENPTKMDDIWGYPHEKGNLRFQVFWLKKTIQCWDD